MTGSPLPFTYEAHADDLAAIARQVRTAAAVAPEGVSVRVVMRPRAALRMARVIEHGLEVEETRRHLADARVLIAAQYEMAADADATYARAAAMLRRGLVVLGCQVVLCAAMLGLILWGWT
jgi:hypothetical protein